ncbi:hypothetical protein H5410_042197 [Solanum commersonii]|uniref:Uncharacterized protein n=1 Tax=Solanum commersonii TaxID=4109 RepID=A0A9J5XTN1_SOLCO|nr:hypothetical protein H5410_042197 [Solanum commersonii]
MNFFAIRNSDLVPIGEPTYFQGQTSPRAVHRFLVIWNFNVIFGKKNSWTSFMTLDIEPVSPNEILAHFLGQTNPRSDKPRFVDFLCAIDHGFLTFVKTLAIDPVGPDGQIGPFSGSNKPQSSQLGSMGNSAHFKGQTSPRARKPPVYPIVRVLYSMNFW